MYAPPTRPLPSLSRLPLQSGEKKRPWSDPSKWGVWGVDAGPAKAPFLKCTAQWETMLEEAINVLGPPLLALCKPVIQIPQTFIRYEHKFCGENFVGERDNSMKFVVEARRVLNAPGSKLTYTFTVKMSLGNFREEYATQLLHNRLVKNNIDHAQQVSLDAWRKKWQEQSSPQVPEKLTEEIRETLVGILVPWLKFFHDHFTYLSLIHI